MDPNNFHSTLTLKKDKNMNSTFWLLTHYGFAEFSFVEEEVYLFIYLFVISQIILKILSQTNMSQNRCSPAVSVFFVFFLSHRDVAENKKYNAHWRLKTFTAQTYRMIYLSVCLSIIFLYKDAEL